MAATQPQRSRLRSAAERHGLKLEFVRTTGLVVRFKILPEDDAEATEASAPGLERELAA
jgi:hypothetical protein